jgi:hypothetical protein
VTANYCDPGGTIRIQHNQADRIYSNNIQQGLADFQGLLAHFALLGPHFTTFTLSDRIVNNSKGRLAIYKVT